MIFSVVYGYKMVVVPYKKTSMTHIMLALSYVFTTLC